MMPLLTSVVVAQTPINAADTIAPSIPPLTRADEVIWWAGVVVVAVMVAVWLVRSRRDPLAQAPPRPNRLQPEHVIALMIAFFVCVVLLQAAAGLVATDGGLKLTAGNLAQMLGGIACLVMGARLFDGGLGRFVLGRGGVAGRIAEGVVLAVAALTVCGVVYTTSEWVIHLVAPTRILPEHSVIDALRTGAEPAWPLWLGAALVAPVAEELFFRGLAQTLIRKLTNRPWFAVVLTAVAFGLAHAQQPQVIPTIAALGVILGVSYERSGSLVAPITVHVLFNSKTLIWEALGAAG
ncbi:MAG TPA: type II CAAX endopeptidase family protein [Phycisphaerae bacterium]|nr:type II CAAX endopeptidase family protein [Phycisphaerae bacterium]